jgi:hypothetical protein
MSFRTMTPGSRHSAWTRPSSRMWDGSSTRPAERAVVRRRAGGERRVATRPRLMIGGGRGEPAFVYASGDSRPSHHRERGGAPASGSTKGSWPELMRRHVRQ